MPNLFRISNSHKIPNNNQFFRVKLSISENVIRIFNFDVLKYVKITKNNKIKTKND